MSDLGKSEEKVLLRTRSGRTRLLPRLPSSWQWTTVGKISEVFRGASPRPKGDPRYFGGSIPWIMISDVTRQEGKYLFETKQGVTEAGARLSRRLPPGSLILSNSGTVCVPKILKVEGCVHDGFVSFDGLGDHVNLDYADWWFECVRPEMIQENRQGITQVNLNTDIVREIHFPLPPRAEQSRIAEALDELFSDLDAGLAAAKQVHAKLSRYRAALLKAAVEGTLTVEWREQHPYAEPASELLNRILSERRRGWEERQLRKFSEKGQEPTRNWKGKYREPVAPDTTGQSELPGSWCWASFDQIGHTQGGLQKSPTRTPTNNPYPYVRVANVHRGALDLRELHRFEVTDEELNRLRLQSGDLLIVEGNGSRTEIGRCALWVGAVDDCVHQNHIIRVRPLAGVIPEYVNLFLNSPDGQKAIQWVASSTSGLYTLSIGKIQKLPLALPPTDEQEAIVEAIDDQLSVIQHIEADLDARLKSTQTLRHSIHRYAFTGRLVSQDSNDEPAADLLKRIAEDREARPREAAAKRKRTQDARFYTAENRKLRRWTNDGRLPNR